MKHSTKFLFVAFLISSSLICYAADDGSGIGISLEGSKKITKDFGVSLEGEFRTQEGISSAERFSLGLGADYRFNKYLKANAGYVFIDRHKIGKYYTSSDGDYRYVDPVWSVRHRVYASLSGQYSIERVTFSLRERFQYTYIPEYSTSKYDGDTMESLKDKVYDSDYDMVLRTRLQAKWNVRKSNFSPFASVELFNDLKNGFKVSQVRYTLGTEYKINKKNELNLFIRYKDKSFQEEEGGFLLGIGYSHSF